MTSYTKNNISNKTTVNLTDVTYMQSEKLLLKCRYDLSDQ